MKTKEYVKELKTKSIEELTGDLEAAKKELIKVGGKIVEEEIGR